MKRMIAVLTALIMVFTSAVALADNSSGVKLVAVAGNIESNQVTVDIMLTENTGIAGIKLAVKYDTSKMKALNVEANSPALHHGRVPLVKLAITHMTQIIIIPLPVRLCLLHLN